MHGPLQSRMSRAVNWYVWSCSMWPDCLLLIRILLPYNNIRKPEISYSAARNWTGGERNKIVPSTTLQWKYYSSTTNWTYFWDAWIPIEKESSSHAVWVKMNSLHAYYCIIRRGMQSVSNILFHKPLRIVQPSCYIVHDWFYQRNGILSQNTISKFFIYCFLTPALFF